MHHGRSDLVSFLGAISVNRDKVPICFQQSIKVLLEHFRTDGGFVANLHSKVDNRKVAEPPWNQRQTKRSYCRMVYIYILQHFKCPDPKSRNRLRFSIEEELKLRNEGGFIGRIVYIGGKFESIQDRQLVTPLSQRGLVGLDLQALYG